MLFSTQSLYYLRDRNISYNFMSSYYHLIEHIVVNVINHLKYSKRSSFIDTQNVKANRRTFAVSNSPKCIIILHTFSIYFE